jgi:hypothetical protein
MIEIQRLDKEIDRLEEGKIFLSQAVRAKRQKLNERIEALEEIKRELEGCTKVRRCKERELQAKEMELKKFKEQLLRVKDNREYKALDKEKKFAKSEIIDFETEILLLLEKEDTIAQRTEELSKEIDRDEQKIAHQEAQNSKEIKSLNGKISNLKDVRQGIVKGIYNDVLARYERLRKGTGGLAIVAVENNACGGCNMRLPPQLVNEIKRNDQFLTCENCGRILYWPEGILQHQISR